MRRKHLGSIQSVFKFCSSIFYGFASPCYSSAAAAADVSFRVCYHMIPQVIVTPVLLNFLFATERSRWYLRQSAVMAFCFRYSHFVVDFRCRLKRSTMSWQRLLIIWQFCATAHRWKFYGFSFLSLLTLDGALSLSIWLTPFIRSLAVTFLQNLHILFIDTKATHIESFPLTEVLDFFSAPCLDM